MQSYSKDWKQGPDNDLWHRLMSLPASSSTKIIQGEPCIMGAPRMLIANDDKRLSVPCVRSGWTSTPDPERPTPTPRRPPTPSCNLAVQRFYQFLFLSALALAFMSIGVWLAR